MILNIKLKDKIVFRYIDNFISAPIGETKKSTIWETCDFGRVIIQHKGKQYTISVSAGFIHDYGSVPKFGRIMIDPVSIVNPAYVIHDLAYRTKGFRYGINCLYKVQDEKENDVVCNRKTADVLLYKMAKHLTKFDYRAWFIYSAVRIGGARHFGGPCPSV